MYVGAVGEGAHVHMHYGEGCSALLVLPYIIVHRISQQLSQNQSCQTSFYLSMQNFGDVRSKAQCKCCQALTRAYAGCRGVHLTAHLARHGGIIVCLI